MTENLLFPERTEVVNPMVVIKHTFSKHDFHFEVRRIKGKFYLVIPNTAKEVFYIQMLLKNVDVLVPQDGDGLIISANAVECCDYRS